MTEPLHPFVRELLASVEGAVLPAPALARALHTLLDERAHLDLIFAQLVVIYDRCEPLREQLHQLLAVCSKLDAEGSVEATRSLGEQLRGSAVRPGPALKSGLMLPKTTRPYGK